MDAVQSHRARFTAVGKLLSRADVVGSIGKLKFSAEAGASEALQHGSLCARGRRRLQSACGQQRSEAARGGD